jgi:prepilin-type N-terminal cleavage/methylation domain-containing protein
VHPLRTRGPFRSLPRRSLVEGGFRPWLCSRLTSDRCPLTSEKRGRFRGFTLVELLAVIAVISILFALVVPAFTTIKTGNDITNAAYTIKGLLEQARNYALINGTYTWVGFFEEDGATASTSPATTGNGRLVISIVASKDGTIVYQQPVVSPMTAMDPTKLAQISKLVKFDNVHLRTFGNGTGTGAGDTFPTRPPVPGTSPDNAKIGDTSPPDSLRPFQYPLGNATSARYTFKKLIEFSPRGEARVNNINYTIRGVLEVGVQPIRGTIIDNSKSCAIQVTGFSGNSKVYQP